MKFLNIFRSKEEACVEPEVVQRSMLDEKGFEKASSIVERQMRKLQAKRLGEELEDKDFMGLAE